MVQQTTTGSSSETERTTSTPINSTRKEENLYEDWNSLQLSQETIQLLLHTLLKSIEMNNNIGNRENTEKNLNYNLLTSVIDFKEKENEHAKDWIQHFEKIATVAGWNDELKKL